ncbi:MAG: hypothetical protein OET44_00890 [Gammaproteobacteria bacterium]|nr:hypothetical protein [Gammaproteobacteria bacterium]
MQVNALLNAPTASAAPAKPVPRVQPVNAIVRYSASSSHGTQQSAYETTLEGEFLRGAGHGQPRHTANQVLPGRLVNAARAVSAYTSVSASTGPDNSRVQRRLDLHA